MQAKRTYDFGPFRLDPAERRLLRDNQPVALTPKCFDLLVVFVENSGRLLGKEELLQRLWPDQFVEEANLSFNISTLRKALGEGQNGQHFIETVPKKGFRFVAPVDENLPDHPAPRSHLRKETTEQTAHAIPLASTSHFPRSVKIVAGLITVSALVYLCYALWIRRTEPPIAPAARTIAVLPFKPLSAASRDESLEMGMTETLITKLGSISQLRVRPFSAVRKFTDLQQDPIKAGQEVQAEAVLDGSIQKAGDQVRVTARLTNVKTGEVIWAEQFDDGSTNILKMQDSISERVIQALTLKLSSGEQAQLRKHYTENPEAYDLYQRASYIFNKPSAEIFANRRKALELYELAIARDPKFALPYVGISEFYLNAAPLLTNLPPAERIPKAKEAILKALELDNTLAEAHNALAEFKYQYEFDWSGAEEQFKQATSLDPNASYIRLAHGWYLMCAGLFEQADAEMQRAQELYPSSLDIGRARGMLLFYQRQYDKAIKHYERMREVESKSHRTNMYMSMAYQQKGMYGEAVEEFLEHGRTIGFLEPEEILGLRKAFQTSGWQGFLRQRLVVANEKPKSLYIPPTIRAGIYGLLGDKDSALSWLEKGIEERDPDMSQIKINPAYDSLRSDPRFISLLQRVNLAP